MCERITAKVIKDYLNGDGEISVSCLEMLKEFILNKDSEYARNIIIIENGVNLFLFHVLMETSLDNPLPNPIVLNLANFSKEYLFDKMDYICERIVDYLFDIGFAIKRDSKNGIIYIYWDF